jgi:hypothetical protein
MTPQFMVISQGEFVGVIAAAIGLLIAGWWLGVLTSEIIYRRGNGN